MAPEQFYGKAVFASDVYSVGITMYQMLTGELPYATPAPSDIERLVRGELVTPPRVKNGRIPKAINDIVMKALAADVKYRYQRASDLLEDVLAGTAVPRAPGSGSRDPKNVRVLHPGSLVPDAEEIHSRLRARETPQASFCWHCRKPLHARSDRCPFCGEAQ
jgi:serine/threonine protein kinase